MGTDGGADPALLIERDPRLEEVVANLRTSGLPEAESIDNALAQARFTDEQKSLLVRSYGAVEAFMEAHESRENGVLADDDSWSRLWIEARKSLADAIAEGLLYLQWIQERAVFFGAIPDPKDSFKYYGDPSGCYCCWKCGAEVQVVQQHCSLWDRPLVGYGEVKVVPKPYCPQCETRPSDTGVIYYKDLPEFKAVMP